MIEKTPFLEGKTVSLRPLTGSDLALLTKWLNDQTVTHFMFYGQRPWTIEQVTEHIKQLTESPANVVMMVEDKIDKKTIGFAGLYDIHPTARKAEYRILLGEPSTWGKGLGTEVTELLTFYGFDRLNLNRIFLGVTDENQGGVKAYEKAGYKQEGVLRQDIYRNSQYYDTVRMGLLREEYYRTLHAEHQRRFSVRGASSKEALSK